MPTALISTRTSESRGRPRSSCSSTNGPRGSRTTAAVISMLGPSSLRADRRPLRQVGPDVPDRAQDPAEGDARCVGHPQMEFLAQVRRDLLGLLALDDPPVLLVHAVGEVVEDGVV